MGDGLSNQTLGRDCQELLTDLSISIVKLDEDLRLQGVWVDGDSIVPAF